MKKIFTTFCAIALTAVVAQAQNTDADAAAKTQQVKKEAVSAHAADAQNAQTVDNRAEYEAYKQKQLQERKARTESTHTPAKAAANNSGETKRVTNSEERKAKASATKKRKLTPEQQKAREEKIRRDN